MSADSRSDGLPPAGDGLGSVIEKAKRELEHMMDLNPQVMLLLDHEGTVVRANRAMLNFLGLPSFRELLNQPLLSLLHTDDEAALADFLQQPSEATREFDARLPGGELRTLLLRIVSGGDTGLRVVIIEDVTVQKAESVHLEKMHKIEAVEALMGALMHNINQPLTVIMVTARLMHLSMEKGTWKEDELKKNLQEIMDLTMSIASLLDKAKMPRDFVTEEYLDGMNILDIDGSSGSAADESTTAR